MNPQSIFPIIKKLEYNSIAYSLGGSGLLYYLGLTDAINDWDLTVECPKNKLIEVVQDYEWTEHPSGDYPFASQYRISIDALQIDFIGYFAVHTDKAILHLPVHHMGRLDGINISSPEVWYLAYYFMNRRSKANTILNYLKAHREKVNPGLIRQLMQTNTLNREISEQLTFLIQ